MNPASLDSMVVSIKGAFKSRFRRQRPRTETEEATEVNTALLRTEGTSIAEDEEARAEEEERKRKMRLLRLRTEEEEEVVDVDLYHFRRQWTHRPRYLIVLFKIFVATRSIQRLLAPQMLKEVVQTSKMHLKQLLRDRIGIVARWSEYGENEANENEQYKNCFGMLNCYKFSLLLDLTCIHETFRCPHSITQLQPLKNLAKSDNNDMICTLKDPQMIPLSTLSNHCHFGTKLWSPLPRIVETSSGYLYAKPTVVKSYGKQKFHIIWETFR
ncbi:unnamed protein product [Anisakis simplex]|uniref:DUF4806 domain-containing protein n=1 Tax=Anisakis simplex TaxID=6269 RepID=A0A0M3JVD8_ANISI|nr:unnamed protein product [Anisakis simplex]